MLNVTKEETNERALKHLLGQALLQRLSTALVQVYPSFDKDYFLSLMPALKPLEMKARVQFLSQELQKLLPKEYKQALKIILHSTENSELKGFDLWPYTEFVQTYGLDEFESSLHALKTLTTLFTAEWAVRPFIKHYPQETLNFLNECARDKNVHIRRWASEGTRPRLPWGERLSTDPSTALAILEELKFDEELYVRKSVANHLGDIAKVDPDLVLNLLGRWKQGAGQEHKSKIEWLLRHSLRSLIKKGHVGSLALLGLSQEIAVEIKQFKIQQIHIKVGDELKFEFELHSQAAHSQKLVVDYLIHFVKANNSRTSKAFKLKTFELSAQETRKLQKRHSCKKISTRIYYPGLHLLEIQVNGLIVASQEWQLEL